MVGFLHFSEKILGAEVYLLRNRQEEHKRRERAILAIELVKRGNSIDLTKNNPGLQKVIVGLSWGGKGTLAKPGDGSVGGFFQKLFGKAKSAVNNVSGAEDVDIDSSIILIDGNAKVVDKIYYGNRRSSNGSVVHAGDDLTGKNKQGVYDNEEISVDLSRLPANVTEAVVLINIFSAHNRRQHFGQVDSYCRVLNGSNREQIVHYDMDDDYSGKTALIVGKFKRSGANEWQFQAIGKGTSDGSLNEIINTYLRG